MELNFTPMRQAQIDHMFDRCNLIRYTVTQASDGSPIETPIVESGVKCGFSYTQTFDKDNGVWLSTGNTADLRLPIGTTVDSVMDVTVVNGVAASGIWSTDGEPQISNTCIILNLKKGVV